MNKPEIANSMARRSGISRAEAADRLDAVVRQILADLRRGREAALPGLGSFAPGPGGTIAFRREGRRRGD
jgi:nucleoid DNA-binding protein